MKSIEKYSYSKQILILFCLFIPITKLLQIIIITIFNQLIDLGRKHK